MSSFFSRKFGSTSRDTVIKQSLISHLSTCVKDLQVEKADPGSSEESFLEVINALCTTLEAIFIHGLKDSFLRKVSNAIQEIDSRPDPNFWGPLLVISHRDVIDQILQLNLIQTDVGRCRAWLRLALNECLLSRYLDTLKQEGQSALSSFYKKGALLRDAELLDVSQGLLMGMESYSLNLPLNSSLLDSWTMQPLFLAGIWTSPMRTTVNREPIADATEAVEKEERDTFPIDALSVSSLVSQHSTGINQMLKLNEEEALKVILGTPVDDSPISSDQRADYMSPEVKEEVKQPTDKLSEPKPKNADDIKNVEQKKNDEESSAVGNSLSGRLGWSSSMDESTEAKQEGAESKPPKLERRTSQTSGSHMVQSYSSLLESYNTQPNLLTEVPDLENILQRFERGPNRNTAVSPGEEIDLSYPEGLGFEIVNNISSNIDEADFRMFLKHVTKIPRELGFDKQDYTCADCAKIIDITSESPNVCGLTAKYYCIDCTVASGEEMAIPARIVYNWDFRRFSLSRKAANFLREVHQHPLFDLKKLNPCLYLAIDEMNNMHSLRNELNLLRAYLCTCREPVIEEMQKLVWPREYLYEHVHLYSIADLIQISNGSLPALLKQVIAFARRHVLSCHLCSQKGFICLVCNDPEIIYPFDTGSTYRCKGCNGLFHNKCLNGKKPCKLCEIKKERASLSSASHSSDVES